MNSDECRSEKKPRPSLQQLVEHARADCRRRCGCRCATASRCGRRWRAPLIANSTTVMPPSTTIAVQVAVDIGLVDDVADQIGAQRGAGGRDRHQHEGDGVFAPMHQALFGQQPPDQGDGAVTLVVGRMASCDRSSALCRACRTYGTRSVGRRQRARGRFLACWRRIFQAKSWLEAAGDRREGFGVRRRGVALARQPLFPGERMGDDGVEILELRAPVERRADAVDIGHQRGRIAGRAGRRSRPGNRAR